MLVVSLLAVVGRQVCVVPKRFVSYSGVTRGQQAACSVSSAELALVSIYASRKARKAFYSEDWFLAVYPWSAPPLINSAVTRLDSARSQAWMLPKLAA